MKKTKNHKTDASAESLLNTVNEIFEHLGGIISIGLIVLGLIIIIALAADSSFAKDLSILTGILFIIAGAVNLLFVLLILARLKIWINMSRNLFNINEQLKALNNTSKNPENLVENTSSFGNSASPDSVTK